MTIIYRRNKTFKSLPKPKLEKTNIDNQIKRTKHIKRNNIMKEKKEKKKQKANTQRKKKAKKGESINENQRNLRSRPREI